MRISIFGLGYVGTVCAGCLAQEGHQIIGVDPVPTKVDLINAGKSTIIEAEIGELIAKAVESGRLRATDKTAEAVENSELSFICVGTPSQINGNLDLTHVRHVCEQIGRALKNNRERHTVVIRSTVLPGTMEKIVIPVLEEYSGKKAGTDFGVCNNPEFLREGSAVKDFKFPSKTVMGEFDGKSGEPLAALYTELGMPTVRTDLKTAEMIKYIDNSWHALKIGFANEIGNVCKSLSVDAHKAMEIFFMDKKLNISPAYLLPGFAFGGSCLPKDLRALSHRAKELDLGLPLLESILPSNMLHIDRAVESVLRTNKKKIAFLGLSFKPGTDDLRESPQVQMIKRLLGEGCQLRVWDRDVLLGRLAGSNRQYIEEVIPHIGSLLSDDLEEVVRSGEVVVVATKVDKDQLASWLSKDQVVVDLINLAKNARPRGGASYQGICW